MPRRYFLGSSFMLGVWVTWIASAVAADLSYPLSIAVTESGIIYLADRDVPGIWKIEAQKLSMFYEGSRKFRTPLNAIRCVTIDREGRLLAGDSSTREVYRFDEAGRPVGLTHQPRSTDQPPAATAAPNADEAAKKDAEKKDDQPTTSDKDKEKEPTKAAGPAPAAPQRPQFVFGEIGIPMDIAVDKAGDLFVADLEIHRIVKVAKAGGPAHEFVQIQAPRGLCMDDEENLWVVSGRKLVKISPAGEKTTIVEDGTFSFPHTVAVATDKTAYVCDGYEKCVWKVPPGGKPEKLVSGTPFVNPVGMRLVADKLYVVDPRAKAVFEITLDGKLTTLELQK